ncbi:helix-turn-helix domain-containing protein [Treponema sp. R6D11]
MGSEVESINDRVKKVRLALGMTQEKFAEKIFVTHGQISAMELDRSAVNKQNINLICSPNTFAEGKTVNMEWLCNGNGDMFVPPPPDNGRPKLFDENSVELPADEEELIGVFRELLPENKRHVQKNAEMILEAQENTKQALGITKKGEADRRADTSKKPV